MVMPTLTTCIRLHVYATKAPFLPIYYAPSLASILHESLGATSASLPDTPIFSTGDGLIE